MALELASGADFWCKLMSGGAPGRSKGVPGSISWLKPRKNGPKILIFTHFYHPFYEPVLRGLGVDFRAKTQEKRTEHFDFYTLSTTLFRTGPYAHIQQASAWWPAADRPPDARAPYPILITNKESF